MARRDVLVISGGLVPQLVTETLHALGIEAKIPRARDGFWPHEVIVVGTSETKKTFTSSELGTQMAALCKALNLPCPEWKVEAPDAVVDVRTDDDAIAFGNLVTKLIRERTAVRETRLHVSISGGRKTQAFHLGAALSLYGRDQDRLSHVLIAPPEAERAANFWYPTTYDLFLVGRPPETAPPILVKGSPLNARYVDVDIADIPFVSVRSMLPEDLITKDLDYREVVEQARLALDPRRLSLTLDPSRQTVQVAGQRPFDLEPRTYALYQLLCEWAKDQRPGAGKDGDGREHMGWISVGMIERPQDCVVNPLDRFRDICRIVSGDVGDPADFRRLTDGAGERGINGQTLYFRDTSVGGGGLQPTGKRMKNTSYFGPRWSALVKALKASITSAGVRSRLLTKIKPRGKPARYGVLIEPNNIEIL